MLIFMYIVIFTLSINYNFSLNNFKKYLNMIIILDKALVNKEKV